MELWIRSQNKQVLTKCEEIELVDNEDYFSLESMHYVFGDYKTKERALEVLDEIQRYITPTIQMLDDTIGGKQVCQIGNITTIVYQMPKE